MITPQFILALSAKLVIDLFAGGGGASTGIEQAIHRHVDVAINHDADAIGIPPDYYGGMERDAFNAAYRRCGHDLAELRTKLATPPLASEAGEA